MHPDIKVWKAQAKGSCKGPGHEMQHGKTGGSLGEQICSPLPHTLHQTLPPLLHLWLLPGPAMPSTDRHQSCGH